MSSILDLADARLRGITLPADDGVAQDILDEIEAWLASRLGPLAGERTETFTDPASGATLRLRRPTDIIDVTDDAVAVSEVELRSEVYVLRTAGYWGGPVEVTYTPTDEELIRGVLYGLVRLDRAETGYESETIGSYSYRRGTPATAGVSRWALIRRLLPAQTFDSVPVRSAYDRPFAAGVVTSDSVTVAAS